MPERIVGLGTHRFTKVVCLDEPGSGGACHEYRVVPVEPEKAVPQHLQPAMGIPIFGSITFQNGPIKEAGVNGLHNEDLLNIVVDRLQHFQRGPFACRENEEALTKIEEALLWLNHRTEGRQARGVEGTNQR